MDDKPLAELVQEHDKNAAYLDECRSSEAIARSRTSAALNALNATQKAIDTHLAGLRKNAPRDSEWANASKARMDIGERP